MPGRPYYVLKLFIDTDEKALRNLYIEAINKHNTVVKQYLRVQEQDIEQVYVDAGFDLLCPEQLIMAGRQTYKVNHQVKAAMEFMQVGDLSGVGSSDLPWGAGGNLPVGYYLYTRSSTGTKTPLRLANSVGIIDAGYRGHLISVFDNWANDNFTIEPYQRLVQICPPNLTYPLFVKLVDREEELGQTARGERGFGSTGR
jgi:dUTP pyrophosphatase